VRPAGRTNQQKKPGSAGFFIFDGFEVFMK
jgi:hypothetical protein